MSIKKKKVLLMIGVIALFLTGICFMANRNIEDYGMGIKRTYTLGAITGADVSIDEAYTVIADNFQTVLLFDNVTKKISWMKSAGDLCSGYAQIGKVVMDEQGYIYVQLIRYDQSYNYVTEESICQFDLTGKEIGRFAIPDIAAQKQDSKIRGFKCQEGYLYYYNENISSFVRMDTSSGQVETYGAYDSEKIDDSFMLGFTEDDTITLAYIDGTLALGYPDGSYEETGRVNYQLSEEGTETIVNQYLYFAGRHFVTDGRYFDTIFEYTDGQLEKLIDISDMLQLDAMLVYDYYYNALNGGIVANNNGNGMLVITFADNLYYTSDMEEIFMMEPADTYKVPSSIYFKGWMKFIAKYLMYLLGLIGLILVCGSIMKWRLSLRSKLFIIIMPITLGGIILVSYYEMNTIEKDFKEQQYEEYDAISSFYRNQIDSDTILSIESLDDADKLEEVRQTLMKNMEAGAAWTDSVNINVYRYFDNNVHLLLYSTTTDCLFVSSFLFDFDTKEQYRLPDSDTYHYETQGIATTYLDSITYLRDENNEIYGFIDVYGNLDKLQISQNQIKQKVVFIIIVLGLILGVLLYIFAYYIVRHLRMTSKTVGDIAQGNFNARVEKLTKDELGVIGTGVNDMADKIESLFEEQEEFSTQVIETLVGTIDAKDKYTNGHSIRVAKYSKMIAQKLGKSPEECRQIYYVGLLHDIGKIGVPDEIINKTSRLTDEEFAIIKTHPDIGYNLLCKLTKIENVSIGAHYHHERYDGRGYPEGLKGEEIPEIARIIAVADTYDAMTSNRSYRKAMTQEKVRGEIEKGKGTQFDPQFADKMLDIDLEIAEIIYENTFSLK